MNKGFYSLKQIVELTTLSRATIWRQCRMGTFPRPIKLSGYRNGWLREEVDNWIEDKVECRNLAIKSQPIDMNIDRSLSGAFNVEGS